MEKPPPPDPTCPLCKKPAQFARPVNARVEFWECEVKHMFVVDKKPPPKVPAGSVAEPAAETKVETRAETKAETETKSA
jgi:hypothetical protein